MERQATARRRALIDQALAALPEQANPTEGPPEGSVRRHGCEYESKCITVATAGTWRALSCAECELRAVPVDWHKVATPPRGGQTWIDEQDGIRNRDVGPLKAALDKQPVARGSSWKDEQVKTKKQAPTKPVEESMSRAKSVFEMLPDAARPIIGEAVGSSESRFAEWYAALKKACPKSQLGSAAAFRMWILGQRRKRSGKPARPATNNTGRKAPTKKVKAKKAKAVTVTQPPLVKPKKRKAIPSADRSPSELAQRAVTIVEAIADLTEDERSRVIGSVNRLLATDG